MDINASLLTESRNYDVMWTRTPIKLNHVMHFGRNQPARMVSDATSHTRSALLTAKLQRRNLAWASIGKLLTA